MKDLDDDDDCSETSFTSAAKPPRSRSRNSRRTTFHLAENEEIDDDGSASDVQRLMKSVERAARRVVQEAHRPSFPLYNGSENSGSTACPSPGYNYSKPILGVKGDSYFEQSSPFMNETGIVNIRRPVYSQSNFEKIWEEHSLTDHDPSITRFFDNIHVSEHSRKRCGDIIWGFFPFLGVLKNYNIKRNLFLDIMSGITTGVLRIPQSMAYALLARMPPIYGLYTAFFSSLFYIVFGGSSHMAAGAQGVISLMVGAGVDKAVERGELGNVTNANLILNMTGDSETNMELVQMTVAITLTVGIIQLLLGIFQLGFVTNYLSDPLIGGFTCGAACHVVVSQLSTMLGIHIGSYSGNFNLFYLLGDILINVDKSNIATVCISLFSLVLLGTIKFLNTRYKSTFKIPIPGELIVLFVTIIFSFILNIDKRWGVKIVGDIPSGFNAPQLPNPKHMANSWDVAFPAAIVSFAVGYSIAKRLALRNDYEISGNQEVFAFGFMNMASSFFGCFTATASMSASSLHDSLGGKTQIANAVASLLVLCTILFIGQLFKPAPDCVLSGIILINLKSILSQFSDLKPLWFVSKIDFLLWVVTWLAVIILDVDIGLGIGVAFSLLTIVFRTQWPYTCVLGRIPSTDIYKNRAITPNAQEVPGIKIYRFEGSLYFASAEHFKNTVYKETECNPVKIIYRKNELKKKLNLVKQQVRTTLIKNGSTIFDNNFCEDDVNNDHKLLVDKHNLGDLEGPNIHHLILDFSSCSFIDSVGVRTLSQVINEYQEIQVCIFLANVRAAVRSMLFNSEAFQGLLGAKYVFLSIHDAVLMALEDAQKMEERDNLIMDAGMKSVTRQCSRVHSDVEGF